MTRKRGRKTVKTEAELLKEKLERDDRKARVLAMREQGLVVEADSQWRIITARRLDVFASLHERKPQAISDVQLCAVRKLEEDMALAEGVGTTTDNAGVRTSTEGAPGQNVSQRMVDASERVQKAMKALGPTNKLLLLGLLSPQFKGAELTRWRDVVEAVTGETNDRAQMGAIRLALSNLAAIYKIAPKEREEGTTYIGQMNARAA